MSTAKVAQSIEGTTMCPSCFMSIAPADPYARRCEATQFRGKRLHGACARKLEALEQRQVSSAAQAQKTVQPSTMAV